MAYLLLAPPRFTSELSLILPGAGASASVNLAEIGQASSYANSPYASNAVSPTVTYRRLLDAGRVLEGAAARVNLTTAEFGAPRVKLVDQTSLILVEMTGGSPEAAQARAIALLDVFLGELDSLRADEIKRREDSARAAIADYKAAVSATRARITALQTKTGLVSSEQYSGMVADMEALGTHLRNLEAELTLRQGSVEALERALGVTPAMAAAALKLHADPEYQALSSEMSERASTLAVARAQYGPKHPTLLDAKDAYAGSKGRAFARAEAVTGLSRDTLVNKIALSHQGERAEILAKLVTLTAERDGLEAEYAALFVRHQALRERVLALIEASSRLDDLQRDYQVAEAVFASALARNDTSKSDVYASYPLVQVLERPSLPDSPSSPKVIMAMGAGVAASAFLLIALVLAWIRRSLVDRLLKGRDQA
ncbi:MAG: hypothetical protein RIC87_18280 [Kiloniellales bacterium]